MYEALLFAWLTWVYQSNHGDIPLSLGLINLLNFQKLFWQCFVCFTVTSQQVEDNDYKDLATSTYTGGDSGFAESSDFLKVPLSGQHQESHDHGQVPYSSGQPEARDKSDGGYAPLNMEAVHTGYYKSLRREGIQGKHIMCTCPSITYICIQL